MRKKLISLTLLVLISMVGLASSAMADFCSQCDDAAERYALVNALDCANGGGDIGECEYLGHQDWCEYGFTHCSPCNWIRTSCGCGENGRWGKGCKEPEYELE